MLQPFFRALALPKPDAVFGLNEAFKRDPRPGLVNLSLGVYLDENGQMPVLDCIRRAQTRLHVKNAPRAYLNIAGLDRYRLGAQKLVFGSNSTRIASVQTLGGTGALHLAAEFCKRTFKSRDVLISRPTWINHHAIFTRAGYRIHEYPYANTAGNGIDFERLLDAVANATPQTVVLLHACCHNPTGLDLNKTQWDALIDVMKSRSLIPVLDMAYQGFGRGLKEDRQAVDALFSAGHPFLVASSSSKNFALYGERVGALHAVTPDEQYTDRLYGLLKTLIRSEYSNPPTYGASLVGEIFSDPELYALWLNELDRMRNRIRKMRCALARGAQTQGIRINGVNEQIGMFSFTGFTPVQMKTLREQYGIYGLDNGRICIAGLNPHNLDGVLSAFKAVQALK